MSKNADCLVHKINKQSALFSMQTLLEKLSAQLDSVRAIEPERIFQTSQPKHRPQRQALDEGLKVYVGPKGGRYRINKNGRKVYIHH